MVNPLHTPKLHPAVRIRAQNPVHAVARLHGNFTRFSLIHINLIENDQNNNRKSEQNQNFPNLKFFPLSQ